MIMNLSENDYPVWSNGDEQSNLNMVNLNGKLKTRQSLNASDVPAWDFQEPMSQADYKMYETASMNSGGYEGAEPAWATSMATWDHESATRLAEQLLRVQMNNGNVPPTDDQKDSMSVMDNQPKYSHQYTPPNGVQNPRFKTEFCRNFREKGDCVYGSQCQFAHGKSELRHDMIRHSKYKTKLCQKYWINGWCAYGTRCNFIHQEEESHMPEKGRIHHNPTGFRPLVASRNLRKSSESSADSGIDPGVMKPIMELQGSRSNHLDVSAGKFNKMETKFESGSVLKIKSFQPSIINCNTVKESKTDMMNMNLATELNRNLYLDIVKVKEKRVVPHPEDNPIPSPMTSLNYEDNPMPAPKTSLYHEDNPMPAPKTSLYHEDNAFMGYLPSHANNNKFRVMNGASAVWNC